MAIINSLGSLPWKAKSIYQRGPLITGLSDEAARRYFIPKEAQIARIRRHLQRTNKMIDSGTKPVVFVAVHHVNWEQGGLIDPWKEMATVIHYDWGTENFDQSSKDWQSEGKKRFNKRLLEEVKNNHDEERIDIFFSYLSGRWVYPETIKKITDLGIITINISFDDKTQFWGYREQSGLSGISEIAKYFDICITSQSKEDVGKYISSEANPLFLPAAGNPNVFSYMDLERTIPISFIGQRYGVRPKYINHLRRNGIDVQSYGLGWPSGSISISQMNEIYNRSLINLGFGFIGTTDKITGLKGRDYEIPLAGNLFLTSYDSSLEDLYRIGVEIDCYRDKLDLIQKVRYYLENPDHARKIGEMGRKRCLNDHTWMKRYSELLSIMDKEAILPLAHDPSGP